MPSCEQKIIELARGILQDIPEHPGQNRLYDDNFEASDDDIRRAINVALGYFNMQPPITNYPLAIVCGQLYSVLPMFAQLVAGVTLRLVALRHARDALPVAGGDVTVDPHTPKIGPYLQIANVFINEALMHLRQWKVAQERVQFELVPSENYPGLP